MGGFSQFTQNMNWAGLINLLLQVTAVLLCLTVHEACHGLAAYRLGDPTARSQHRLSLNPLRHIDPFGALMMIVAGFGWAKPVPVDMRYFRNPKSGMAITALAGPLSNILLAYLALLVRAALIGFYAVGGPAVLVSAADFFGIVAVLSIGLGLFNLIPFPPLDGFKVLGAFLPDRLYYNILRYERWGIIALMALLWSGALYGPLEFVRDGVLNVLFNGAMWPYKLILML